MKFITFIKDNNLGDVVSNKSLKEITSFKIGGICKYFVYPKGIFELAKIIKYCIRNQLKYYVLGNCTNVLISDDYFDCVFISLNKINKIKSNQNKYMLDAGIKANNIGYKLIKDGYEEALPLALIPGTVGGIIYMNATCFKRDITEILKKVVLITSDGKVIVRNSPFDLRYRRTCFQSNKCIIVRVVFSFTKVNNKAIELFKKYSDIKKNTQPLNTFNAGSIFKNPKDTSAWELIDSVGLRGFFINDAKVSEKHCNFLINEKVASFNEMLALIYFIKYKVYFETGIKLETEVKIITPYSI